MDEYDVVGKVGEGAFGVVLHAVRVSTGAHVALKSVSMRSSENVAAIPKAAFREIEALRLLDSPNVVHLHDVFAHGSTLVLVLEYMATDLAAVIRCASCPIPIPFVKAYMWMLFTGVAFMHSHSIIHRDIKPHNLLISPDGTLKLADFGLARVHVRDGLDADEAERDASVAQRPYTSQVATRWYRAPELLYGARDYDCGVDLWAVGCILGELLCMAPLFQGESDIDQLYRVLLVLGSPTEASWPAMARLPDYGKVRFAPTRLQSFADLLPDASESEVRLLSALLCYDSTRRLGAAEAVRDAYFDEEPLPASAAQLRDLARSTAHCTHWGHGS